MTNQPIRLAVVALLAGLPARLLPAQTAGDQAAIERFIQEHAAASRSGDLEGLVSLYTTDAEMIYPNGTRMVGREAIAEAYRRQLAGASARSGRHHIHPPETVQIRFLAPTTAWVELESHSMGGIGADGSALTTSRSLLVTAWVKQDGSWRVAYQRSVPASTP